MCNFEGKHIDDIVIKPTVDVSLSNDIIIDIGSILEGGKTCLKEPYPRVFMVDRFYDFFDGVSDDHIEPWFGRGRTNATSDAVVEIKPGVMHCEESVFLGRDAAQCG